MEQDDQMLGGDHGQGEGQIDVIWLTTDIVSAYVSNNRVPPAEMPALLSSVHAAVMGLGSPAPITDAGPEKPTPAQIRKSIRPDALTSFIDGKPYKTLKRHLTGNGMTIEQYRERYGLPRDYPSTAASYSEQRSALAKSVGLGQQRRKAAPKAAPKAAEVAETIAEVPETSGRKRFVEPADKPTKTRKPKKPGSVAAAE